jgi:hypothetical protein
MYYLPPIEQFIINFGNSEKNQKWTTVVDGVMGGKSTSNITELNNSMLFSGDISLKNNGGFASIRGGRNYENLSKYSTVEVKYRSAGQDFALRLLKHEAFYLPYFKHNFETTDWNWDTVSIPLEVFEEYRLNDETGSSLTNEELEKINRLGIIVSNKIEGMFKIEIDYIKFK